MFADDRGLRVAEHAIHYFFGFGDRLGSSGELGEESLGVSDLPTDKYTEANTLKLS